jgi:hypothetical protein
MHRVPALLSVTLALMLVAVMAPGAYTHPLCHNIGGPKDLGANCDMTGTCTYQTSANSGILTLGPNQFLGILIGIDLDSGPAGAIAAHLAHGDGLAVATFDPPLHLASVTGPHRDSNVECIGTRAIPQPPEPGN